MKTFPKTLAALTVYYASKPARDAKVFATETEADFVAAQAEDKAAEDLVREAFAEETADINSRSNAFLVSPEDPWLHRVVGYKSDCSS